MVASLELDVADPLVRGEARHELDPVGVEPRRDRRRRRASPGPDRRTRAPTARASASPGARDRREASARPRRPCSSHTRAQPRRAARRARSRSALREQPLVGPGEERVEDVTRLVRADEHRLHVERAQRPEQLAPTTPRARCLRAFASLRGQPDADAAAGLRVGERHDDAADVGEALLPDRVADDDGDDLPAALERADPLVARRLLEEVRDDEEEGARRQVAPVLGEVARARARACSPAPRTAGRGRGDRARARSEAGARTCRPPRRGRGSRAGPARRRRCRRSGARPHAPPPACSTTASRRRRRPSTAAGRTARRHAAPPRRSARGRRTRRCRCASESRADAYQSIRFTSSPGWYGREPATSDPWPRRWLCRPPNASPSTRRRWMSGKVAPVKRRRRRPALSSGRGASSRALRRGTHRRAPSQPISRAVATKLGVKTIRCMTTGRKSRSTSTGVTKLAAVHQRPRPRRALERERAAHRRADRDAVGLARRAHEPDHPASEQRVDVDVGHRAPELLDLVERDHAAAATRAGAQSRCSSTIRSSSSSPG